MAVLYLLGCGAVFGLLMYLIGYICREFPSIDPFDKFARIFLVVAMVLVLIGLVLGFLGHPIVRFSP